MELQSSSPVYEGIYKTPEIGFPQNRSRTQVKNIFDKTVNLFLKDTSPKYSGYRGYSKVTSASMQKSRKSEDSRIPPAVGRRNLRRLSRPISQWLDTSESKDSGIDQHNRTLLSTISDSDSDGLQSRLPKQDPYEVKTCWTNLVHQLTQKVNMNSRLENGRPRNIICLTGAPNNNLAVCIEEMPYIFIIARPDNEFILYNKSQPISTDTTIDSDRPISLISMGPRDVILQKVISVPELSSGVKLYPREICVTKDGSKDTLVYVSVWGRRLKAGSNDAEEEVIYQLLKLNYDGAILCSTPLYNYERYAGLSVDVDGNLLLACPQYETKPKSAIYESVLIKLKPDFSRRLFSIGAAAGEFRWPVSQCVNRRCWTTVACRHLHRKNGEANVLPEQSTGLSATAVSNCEDASIGSQIDAFETDRSEEGCTNTGRLYAFYGQQSVSPVNDILVDTYTKTNNDYNWIDRRTWKFPCLCPGRIAAYDENRLLVLDAHSGALFYLDWPEANDQPCLYRVFTRPTRKQQVIQLLCSVYTPRRQKTNRPSVLRPPLPGGDEFYSSDEEETEAEYNMSTGSGVSEPISDPLACTCHDAGVTPVMNDEDCSQDFYRATLMRQLSDDKFCPIHNRVSSDLRKQRYSRTPMHHQPKVAFFVANNVVYSFRFRDNNK